MPKRGKGVELFKIVSFGRVAIIVWHQQYRGSTRVDVEKSGGGGVKWTVTIVLN